MVDRTSELRKKGFEGRRLGPVQMTTDTAVRVTRMVVQGKSTHLPHSHASQPKEASLVPLTKISYVDKPELRINGHESTEMPFRYVRDEKGAPIMPKV